MQNNQTRKLTHGAMMIALFIVLMAIVFYIPMVKILAAIIAPLPMIWYSANYNRKSSLLVAVIAVFITYFIGGLLLLPASLIFAAAGVMIGDAIYHKKSKVFMFISTSLVLLITFAIQYLISLRLFEIDFIRDSLALMKTSYLESIKMTESLTGQPVPKEALDRANMMLDTLDLVIPASITFATILLTFIIISINLPILKRLKVDVPKFAKFSELRLPRSVLWYYLIVLSVNLFVRPEPDSSLAIIMLNISMILWVLLTIQGISFIHFVIDSFGYPKFIKVLSTIVAIPLYSYVVLIGIVDLGFNVRNYIREKSQK